MRILGFSKKWAKLHLDLPVEQRSVFTTFRFPRKDAPKGRDWHLQEEVQLVYHPRGKDREVLGIAEFILKEERGFCGLSESISESEARADGFKDWMDMREWMIKQHGDRICTESMNKWTLKYITG